MPRVVPYKKVKVAAAAKRAQLAAGTKNGINAGQGGASGPVSKDKGHGGQSKLLMNGDLAFALREHEAEPESHQEDVEMED